MRWTRCTDHTPKSKAKVLWVKNNGRLGYGALWLWKVRGIVAWKHVWNQSTQTIWLHKRDEAPMPYKVPNELIDAAEDLRLFMKEQGLGYMAGLRIDERELHDEELIVAARKVLFQMKDPDPDTEDMEANLRMIIEELQK